MSMHRDLAKRDRLLLGYAEWLDAHHGVTPTVRELKAWWELSSTSVVQYWLRELERDGMLLHAVPDRGDYGSNDLVLSEAGRERVESLRQGANAVLDGPSPALPLGGRGGNVAQHEPAVLLMAAASRDEWFTARELLSRGALPLTAHESYQYLSTQVAKGRLLRRRLRGKRRGNAWWEYRLP